MKRSQVFISGLLCAVILGVGLWAWQQHGAEPAQSFDQQLQAAWQNVHLGPEDPAAWARLAEVHTSLDHTVEAEHAYRTALRLGDPSGLSAAGLGFLLYGQGRDDEARTLLLQARTKGADVPMLDFTLAALQPRHLEDAGRPASLPPTRNPPPAGATTDAGSLQLDASVPETLAMPKPTPQPPAPVTEAPIVPKPIPPEPIIGDCTLPLRRQGRVLIAEVWLNGVKANLLVDTGASMTVITEQLADEIRARVDASRSIRAITANGRVDMPTTVVHVELGPYVAEQTRVAVCADCVQGLAAGLLGLDLQAPFHVSVDVSAGLLRFNHCEEP